MKFTCLLSLFLLSAYIVRGQQLKLELPLDSTDAKSTWFSGCRENDTGNILLTVASRYYLRHFRFSNDTAPAAPVLLASIHYDSKKTRFVFASSFPDGVETCITNEDNSLLRFLYSGRDQSTRQTDSLAIPAGQQLFYAFYQEGTFYAITVKKHANTFFVYRRRPANVTEIFQKETNVKKWGVIWWHGTTNFIKNRVDNFYDLIKSVGMTQWFGNTPPPMGTAVCKSKCYIRQGMLYLTFDTHQLKTNLVEIPLDDRPCRLLQFNPEDWYHKPLPPGFSTGNSFILDNTLITAAIVHRQPWLAFYDLHTAKLITSYAPDANGHTSFPRGPIWQVGDFWNKDKIHPIKWEDFAVNAFDFWTMGVSAHKLDSGGIEVRIGTIYNRGNFGDLMLLVGGFTPLFIATAPIAEFSAPPINTMYFNARFENDSFRALPCKETKDKSELINTFVNSQILSSKRINGFQNGNDYWMGWYDAELQKYFIYKF